MIHYTCDRCQCAIGTQQLRYVIKLETQAAIAPLEEAELNDDRDHLMEVHEILESFDSQQSDLMVDDIHQRKTFDMCADCYRQFVKNPLGKETPAQFGFSSN